MSGTCARISPRSRSSVRIGCRMRSCGSPPWRLAPATCARPMTRRTWWLRHCEAWLWHRAPSLEIEPKSLTRRRPKGVLAFSLSKNFRLITVHCRKSRLARYFAATPCYTRSAMLQETLEQGRARTDAALDRLIPRESQPPASIHKAMRHSVFAGGKRLRPVLCMEAGRMVAGSFPVNIEELGAALEMLHTYSLIHDDLPALDNDDLRRGRPTCHKVFGEAMAILAGDGLLSLAFQVLVEGVRPPAVATACCAALAEASGPCQLVGGQADDVAADRAEPATGNCRDQATHDRRFLESIHARKTGAMIRVSLRLGGMTAGAALEQLEALDDYGRRLGLAFQVTDDLLDVRSTEENMGKRVRKDAEKGKITFPGLLGVDESAAYAAQLIADACAALAPMGPQAEGLVTLARYVLERNR